VIFIDSVSYTIVVPVLAAALLSDRPVLLPESSDDTRYIVYGVALGVFELILLYMAPVLGEVSDRSGRRNVLVACLFGAIVSFLLIGASILFNIVALLIFGRILGGATAGSQPVAQAAAVDMSTEEGRPLALSLALLASSLGFVAGPLIGGAMSWDDHDAVTDLVIPMAITAVLAVIGIGLLRIWYRDPKSTKKDRPAFGSLDLWMGVRGFRAAFADPAIRRLILVFGLMQVAWGTFFVFLPSLLYERFDMDNGDISLLLGFLGVGFCVAYGILLPWLSKRVTPRSIVLWSLWGTAVLMLVSVAWNDVTVQWAVAVPIAAIVSVAFGALVTEFSNSVDDDRQGWILGISASINALAWGVSSIVAGFLSAVSYIAPFVLALVALFVSAGLATLPPPRDDAVQRDAQPEVSGR
jgi:MFS transporter, DHA1 family, tetracycline resistance protein